MIDYCVLMGFPLRRMIACVSLPLLGFVVEVVSIHYADDSVCCLHLLLLILVFW